MAAVINPDASRIWDEAEVYVIEKSDLVGSIASKIPATVNSTIDAAWEFVGLLDASAGIPISPEIEINHYDGFGHSRYRSKARKGAVTSGFTALEDNSVTRKFVLPGSAPGKIGAPKGAYFYVMYVLRDEDIITDIWVSTRPALFELSGHSGKVEGEQETYEITVHHANDENGDVFDRVETENPTVWTVTIVGSPTGGSFALRVDGDTVLGVAYNAASSAVDTAVETLPSVGSAGATVTGSAGGPYTVTLANGGVLSSPSAALTPSGSVTVAPA
jgi:hypothetical protein